MLPKLFAYPTVRVMYFTDQKRITKTVYCIRCVMVCKIFYCSEFSKRMEKTGKCKAFRMAVTYYIKLFRTGTDRHNGILMSLLLLVVETINAGTVE